MQETVISQSELRKWLSYEPTTGVWTWLKSRPNGRPVAGTVAGCYTRGRLVIRLNRVGHYAARLAWVYMTGAQPSGDVDHIDRDPSNERWSNLRDVTRSQNCMNKAVQANNSTGYRNIHVSKSGKFVVQVQNMGLRTEEYCSSLEEAIKFRDKKVKEFHGEFKGEYHAK